MGEANQPHAAKAPALGVKWAHTRESSGSCPKCQYRLPRLLDSGPPYFRDGFVVCEKCKERVCLRQAALDHAKMLKETAWALEWIGAGNTAFLVSMKAGDYCEIELTEHAVPANARILSTNVNSQGGPNGAVTALEWHGNTPQPRRNQGTKLRLWAIPLGDGAASRIGDVAISAVWLRPDDSAAWPYLVSAFESVAEKDYAPALVFAQSAVEASMMPLISDRFGRHASAERVKNFMKGALTYGYALNVVLPYICAELKLPKIPDPIRGALNKMRDERNDIIHEGSRRAGITADDAIEGLCAAAFGFEYMRFISPPFSRPNQ